MKVTDFEKGQKIYILSGDRRIENVKERSVLRVGRKYVIAENYHGHNSKFRLFDKQDGFLAEKCEYGNVDLLFPTEQAVIDYKETLELKLWLRKTVSRLSEEKLTLEQLRTIKRIINSDQEQIE